jgi:hypothetical protein
MWSVVGRMFFANDKESMFREGSAKKKSAFPDFPIVEKLRLSENARGAHNTFDVTRAADGTGEPWRRSLGNLRNRLFG